jgi:hypothetical protein
LVNLIVKPLTTEIKRLQSFKLMNGIKLNDFLWGLKQASFDLRGDALV